MELWAEKTGQIVPEDISEKEHVQLGIELEDFVAKKFERETGMKVRRAPKIYENATYPFIRCQVDRLIEKSEELLEVKTCSAWKAKEWEGEEIPQEYILQVMWQLGCTGRKVGWIAVLIGGQSFKYKRIDFDEKLWESMKESALAFWKMVETLTPPQVIGMDNGFIVELYPKHNDQIKEASDDVNIAIAERQELRGHIDKMKERIEEIEVKIKAVIGGNLGIKTDKYVATWKEQKRRTVDTQMLKDDGLYEKYAKESSTRRFLIKNA